MENQAEKTEFIVNLSNGSSYRFYKMPIDEISKPREIQARQLEVYFDMLIQPNDINNTILEVLDILESEKVEPDNLKARLRAADKLKILKDKAMIPDNILRCKVSKAFIVWALDGEPTQVLDSNWQNKKLEIIMQSNEATAFFLTETEILTNTSSIFTADTLTALLYQKQILRTIENFMPSVQHT